MIVDALRKITDGEHLNFDEAQQIMASIMEGRITPSQLGALLGALRAKRESVGEIAGFARVMRAKSIRVATRRRPLIDMCGTGGDSCDTFNISTAACFVVAAAGVSVAKHGNRAVSSRCGSADVLAALGVDLRLSPEQIGQCIDAVGVGFMYAPSHHPAMQFAAQTRQEMGIRTLFNVLGPLTNPAGATHQLVGVFDPDLCPKVAEALGLLGCERAMVVHGMDGLDEVSTVGPTRISHLQNGRVSTETRIPAEFFVVPSLLDELRGADTVEGNAEIVRSVLSGEPGPRRDVVCVNACAGLILGGMAESWRDGLSLAHRMIDSGRAVQALDRVVEFTQGCMNAQDALEEQAVTESSAIAADPTGQPAEAGV